MPLTRLLLLLDLIRPIPAMAQVWKGAVPDDSALCEAGPSAGQGPILSCGGPSAADLTGDKTGHIDPRNTPPGAGEPSLVGCLFPTLGVPEAILGLDAVVAPLDYGLSGVLLGGLPLTCNVQNAGSDCRLGHYRTGTALALLP